MLNEIAPLADLLAAIGVIISLCLVYFELRRGNRDARMANWYKNMEAFREFCALTDDPLIATIVVKGREDIGHLTETEYIVFDNYIRRCVLCLNYFRRNTGQVMEAKHVALETVNENLKRVLDYPGIRAWWQLNRSMKPFAPSTVEWVDRTLA